MSFFKTRFVGWFFFIASSAFQSLAWAEPPPGPVYFPTLDDLPQVIVTAEELSDPRVWWMLVGFIVLGFIVCIIWDIIRKDIRCPKGGMHKRIQIPYPEGQPFAQKLLCTKCGDVTVYEHSVSTI